MKEAIEILRNALPHLINMRNTYSGNGNTFQEGDVSIVIEKIKAIIWPNYTYQPSPDTDYKVALTQWIEKRKYQRHWERDKYVSTWEFSRVTVCPNGNERERDKAIEEAMITGRSALSYNLDSEGGALVKHVDILGHEEGEGRKINKKNLTAWGDKKEGWIRTRVTLTENE